MVLGEISFHGLPRWHASGGNAVLVTSLAIAICVLASAAITA
jgi:hypothetical protein